MTQSALQSLDVLYELLKLSVQLPIVLPHGSIVRGLGHFREKLTVLEFCNRNGEPLRALMRHVASQFQYEKCDVSYSSVAVLLCFA